MIYRGRGIIVRVLGKISKKNLYFTPSSKQPSLVMKMLVWVRLLDPWEITFFKKIPNIIVTILK